MRDLRKNQKIRRKFEHLRTGIFARLHVQAKELRQAKFQIERRRRNQSIIFDPNWETTEERSYVRADLSLLERILKELQMVARQPGLQTDLASPLHVSALSPPEERGPIPTLELSDPEEIQHNTHTSHDPASEELDEELNDFYSNRIELEELLIHEVAFDRSSSEAELDITAIASREAGVIMLVTDRLELYSYDLRSGQKQLCHVFEESAFQHHLERLKTRKREKVSIDNLLAFGKDSFIILVSGNLFRFDTSSKAVELLIPGRQEKEQLLLEGRNGSPQRTQPSGPE